MNQYKVNCADIYFVDTESYDPSDAMRGHGVNDSMIAFDNCLRKLSELNTGYRSDFYVPYENNRFTSFF